MDKLIEQALLENKIVRYIPTFEKVLKTYKRLLDEAEQQVKTCNKPDVSVVHEPVASGAVCPHFNACQNGGKNEYCDLQTFNEIDCFVGQNDC